MDKPKVGDILDVTILAKVGKDGITKLNEYVLFVPGTEEGDMLRVRISKMLNIVGFAEPYVGPKNIPRPDKPLFEAQWSESNEE